MVSQFMVTKDQVESWLQKKDLDICPGHAHGELGYHYHATLDYPYTVGCFRGDPFEQ